MTRRSGLLVLACLLLLVLLVPVAMSLTSKDSGTDAERSTPPSSPAEGTLSGGAGQGRPVGREVKGWELTASNIGLVPFGLSCDELPLYEGPAKPPFGARIVGQRVTDPLDLSNGGITVERSCIQPTHPGHLNNFLVSTTTCGDPCYPPKRGSTVISDSEINGFAMDLEEIAGSCGFMGVATIRRTLFRGMGTGICIMDTGTRQSVLVEQNYVTDLRACCESHNEAATVRDFRGRDSGRSVVFRNNRLSIDLDGYTSGGLFIQPTWRSIYHLDVIGNLIEGIGWNLVVTNSQPGEGAEYDDLLAVDNRFLSLGYGPTSIEGPGWDVWRDNYHYEPGRPDARGDLIPEP